MDNNNTQPAQPQIPTIPPTNGPGVAPIPPIAGNTVNMGSKSKMFIWIIVGIVVVLLAGGGVYYFLNNKKATEPITSQPTESIKTATPEASLEDELNAVDVEATDSAFTSVDQDIQSLK